MHFLKYTLVLQNFQKQFLQYLAKSTIFMNLVTLNLLHMQYYVLHM